MQIIDKMKSSIPIEKLLFFFFSLLFDNIYDNFAIILNFQMFVMNHKIFIYCEYYVGLLSIYLFE